MRKVYNSSSTKKYGLCILPAEIVAGLTPFVSCAALATYISYPKILKGMLGLKLDHLGRTSQYLHGDGYYQHISSKSTRQASIIELSTSAHNYQNRQEYCVVDY